MAAIVNSKWLCCRFDEALTCLTLIKQFSHLVRLFETQFRKNSSASQVPDTQHGIVETKQQGMNDYCLLHIKSAAELHFEVDKKIEATLFLLSKQRVFF